MYIVVLEKAMPSGVLLGRAAFVANVVGGATQRPGRLRSAADRYSGRFPVVRRLCEQIQLVPMFNEIFPLAQCTSSLAPGHFGRPREGVAFRAGPGELLIMSKILDDESLLLPCDRATPGFLQ